MTLPAGYAIPKTTVDPAQVGNLYHLAIGTKSSAALSAPDRVVGFLLQNKQGSEFAENTDLHSKETLTQYASPNLIDRDLVNMPRVTQGRWDLGFLQTVLTDPARYMDSDLETSVPGYLFLKPQWTRSIHTIVPGSAPTPMIVSWNGDFWFTFAEANKSVYAANAGTQLTLPIVAQFIDSDGTFLYFSDGVNIYRRSIGGVNTQIASAVNGGGNILQMWIIQQGTNGYFLYYVGADTKLYKIDVSGNIAFPVAAGSQPQVPMGSTALNVVDIKPYGTAIAILTTDLSEGSFTVWTHDGVNMTITVSVPGYHAHGMCICLGDLYVGGHPHGQTTPPILARVGPGSFDIVAEPGTPFPVLNQSCLAPISSSRYVYWPILNPSIAGVSNSTGYVVRFNVVTGEATHLPAQDNNDLIGGDGSTLRRIAAIGTGIGLVFYNANTGFAQYQTSAFGTIKYQASGQLITSRIDFATPSIAKLLRRLIVTHRPLNAGEKIQVDAYVEKDPLTQTLGSPDATFTNSTLGSTSTVMPFASGTLGKSVFFVLTLTAGTSQLTTPIVYQYAVEVAPGWVWKFTIGCFHVQETLVTGQVDNQGMTARDKYWFLHEIQESPPPQITLYHPNQLAYNGVFEQINLHAKDPHFGTEQDGAPDLEFLADCIFRWTSE
ncbi:MAG: hypothetical protein ACHQC8_02530 [Solirubrobacterales bacterium]